MIIITVIDLHASDAMEIVRDLRNCGLLQGTDFDFAYRPAKFDNFSGDSSIMNRRYTEFKFYNEKNAVWFQLKYGGIICCYN